MLSSRSTMLVAFAFVLSFLFCSVLQADTIFTENFNELGPQTGADTQYGTGLPLGVGGTMTRWSNSGMCTCHCVELSTGNWAVLLWGRNDPSDWLNSVTMKSEYAISANTSGTIYKVSLEAGPGVYRDGNQTTATGDQFAVDVLNSSDNVVSTKTISPDAWEDGATTLPLKSYSFTYTGDGTGNVRIRIRALPSVDTSVWNFVGTVDNLSVSSIPEPATSAITMSAALVALLAYAWRKRK